uniref:Protein kinase domain-containing protein n=1 Tax=Ciona intestinalis TaxID=7719 RepID=A0A1W3JFF0_CIOIN|eukprot:XP_009860631.1 uncharacterized protein LOC780869 [Ciona intestinalis]
MPLTGKILIEKSEANRFLTRKLLKNSWHHFEEAQQGNIERECIEEVCSWEEAREAFETDVAGLNQFWNQYTGVTSNSSEDNPVGMIVGIIFGVIGFIALIAIVYFCWKKRQKKLKRKLHKEPYAPYPVLSFYASKRGESAPSVNHYETPLMDRFDNDLAVGLSECYVERERLQLGEVITSGNFGDVYRGKLRSRQNTWHDVAVKSLKSLENHEDVEKFLREGVMMRGLDHRNVLALIGVCVDGEVERLQTSPLIILPFMENGDLRTFLRDGNNVLTVLKLLKFCKDVAMGMEYLAEKKFVHRDLAARNCMVDKNWCVKVADFGLSRDLFDRDYYRSSVKTQLPLKWMPPESIKYGRYGEKSDVWSYGIVCWEIMTRGAIPYPTVQAVAILQYLSEGNRMERPECCPHKLYKTMEKCWLDDTERRPTFEELVTITTKIVRDARRSVKHRKHSCDSSSSAGSDNPLNPYQNSVKEKNENSKPKPKPRTSLRLKDNERSDKYSAHQENKERRTDERGEKKEEEEKEEKPSSRLPSNTSGAEVGFYNDTDNQARTISV